MKSCSILFAFSALTASAAKGGTAYVSAAQALGDLKARAGNGVSVTSIEIIQRAHEELPPLERNLFVEGIKRGHQASPNDTGGLFLQGYSQVVFRSNKSGLRLLRVSDERLRSPASALAYGLALAELNRTQATSDTDLYVKAIWNLQDAWRRNQTHPEPGFEQRFTQGLERLGFGTEASRIPAQAGE